MTDDADDKEGVLLAAASIPLEANGQTSWLIDQTLPPRAGRRYFRLRGIGALRCAREGAVYGRGLGVENGFLSNEFDNL